ncbi:hypothetical protein HY745_08405 [Candidatus Desantisbacteria bacterium]|nr:hypothetical protein [Candidatus Desantisbacteria bacterium]
MQKEEKKETKKQIIKVDSNEVISYVLLADRDLPEDKRDVYKIKNPSGLLLVKAVGKPLEEQLNLKFEECLKDWIKKDRKGNVIPFPVIAGKIDTNKVFEILSLDNTTEILHVINNFSEVAQDFLIR